MFRLVAAPLFVFVLLGAPFADAADIIAPGAKPEVVVDNVLFGEGPAVDAEGNVYFSDVIRSEIRMWHTDGTVSLVRDKTGGANGLYFDGDGNLFACEGRNRRISMTAPDGTITSVADRWQGKRFHRPNDLWVDPKGGVYFTDPSTGRPANAEIEGNHVYYIPPDGSAVVRATEDLVRPNGIIGTRDGTQLYVADIGAERTYRYDIGADGALTNKTQFLSRGSDGMTLDEQGNLYVTGPKYVEVYDAKGSLIETIQIARQTTNVTFGDVDRKTLFITCRGQMSALKMKVKGQ